MTTPPRQTHNQWTQQHNPQRFHNAWQATRQQPTKWTTPAIAAVTVAASVLLIVVLFALVAATTGPQRYEITGSMSVPASYLSDPTTGGCSPSRGFDDITEGASVTVRDATGTTVAVTNIGPAVKQYSACVHNFVVEMELDSSAFYSFEVGRRGEVTYTSERLLETGPSLSLG